MSILPDLERQLVDVADRVPSRERRRRRWIPRPGSVGLALSVAVTIAVATTAALLLAHRSAGVQSGQLESLNHDERALADILAVLRQPQTPAAAGFRESRWPTPPTGKTQLDRPLIRLATVTPWGAKVFIVPIKPPPNLRQARALGEVAALWVQGIGWSDYSLVSDIEHGNGWGPGRSARTAAGQPVYRFFEIVPDGVARVIYYLLPGLPRPGKPLRFSGHVTAAVHGNVAAFQTTGTGVSPVYAAWYSADGHLIQRIGDWRLAAPAQPFGDHLAPGRRVTSPRR